MNFRKHFPLVSLIVMALASTAAHADIKNNKGWHYIKMIKNTAIGKSMDIRITNRGNGIHYKCYDIAPWQTVTDKRFLVKSGDVIEYNLFMYSKCGGGEVRVGSNTIRSDKDEYWYVWF